MMPRIATFYLLGLALLLGSNAGAQAAEFTLTDSKGKVHKLSQYKGKWVLVNFWATWCPPCLHEIPDLIDLHENKKNNMVVFGVAMNYADPQGVVDFAEGMMVSYPIVLGNPRMAAQIGPIDGLPTSYLYNPDGKLVAYQTGLITKEGVEAFVRGPDKPADKADSKAAKK